MNEIKSKEDYLVNIRYFQHSIGKRDLYVIEHTTCISNVLMTVQDNGISCIPNDDNIKRLCVPTYNPVVIKSDRFVMDVQETATNLFIRIWIINEDANDSLQIVSLCLKKVADRSIREGFWLPGKWDDALAETFHKLCSEMVEFLNKKERLDKELKLSEDYKLQRKIEQFEKLF